LVLGLAAVSTVQTSYWKNTYSLFAHAMAVTERNYIAYAVIGTILNEQGHPAEAMPYLEKALEYQPEHHECRLVLANALTSLRRYDEAFQQYAGVIQINPRSADGYNSWAAALAAAGKFDDALRKLDEALRLKPAFVNAWLLRTLVLQRENRNDEAAAAARQVLTLQPTNISSLVTIGTGFLAQQRAADALPVFREVLKLNPNSIETLNRVAWILATHPDATIRNGPEAVSLATRACDLTGKRDPLCLNALAAAYAEMGRFQDAVKVVDTAVQAARNAGMSDKVGIIEKLGDFYRAGKPYRE
jgi:tetratricopeptide (TPR) repeat protein